MLVRRHDSPLFDFIESCLRNKHEMVVYEAASAIVHMPNCTARELAPAVSGWFLIVFTLCLLSPCMLFYAFIKMVALFLFSAPALLQFT